MTDYGCDGKIFRKTHETKFARYPHAKLRKLPNHLCFAHSRELIITGWHILSWNCFSPSFLQIHTVNVRFLLADSYGAKILYPPNIGIKREDLHGKDKWTRGTTVSAITIITMTTCTWSQKNLLFILFQIYTCQLFESRNSTFWWSRLALVSMLRHTRGRVIRDDYWISWVLHSSIGSNSACI